MNPQRLTGTQGFRHTQKHPPAIGDVLFDTTGYAYRVVALDDPGLNGGAKLCVRPVDEDIPSDSEGLTRRQRQIALLLANRATNAEIAGALGISVHTARHHSQNVLDKLGISSRSQVRSRLAR
jgi:DNA-binding CsgD family transcriptional regulator